ncbi:MAG: hypothetical protein K6C10_09885 [Prevotella sp.]|nr:hypothetical protein [Prevotella sp.]
MKRICLIALTMLFISGQNLWADELLYIEYESELVLLAEQVNNGNTYEGKTIVLTRDLSFSESFIAIGKRPSKPFAGTFDGQGFTITGISINADGAQGLFGYVNGATIKNLTLTGSTIKCTSNSSAGGIVGSVGSNGATIENCHVTNSVTVGSGNSCGGIVGSTELGPITITGCTSGATITNGVAVGGIIGQCGYAGVSELTTTVEISGCLYYGTSLTSDSEKAGGIVGCYTTTDYNGNQQSSSVTLVDNFYTYPNPDVKGVGLWQCSPEITQHFDVFDSNGAVRVRAITDQADIDDMEGLRTDVTYNSAIAYYNRGVKYGDVYYSHVLGLDNAADNTDIINEYAGQAFDLKLRGRRLYKDGSWNTLCLPFGVSKYEGTPFMSTNDCLCEIRTMDVERSYYVVDKTTGESITDTDYHTGVGKKDGKLRLFLFFRSDFSFDAGKPVIVKWQKAEDYSSTTASNYDVFDPIFEDVTISNSESIQTPGSITSTDNSVTFQGIYAPLIFDYADRSKLFVGAFNKLYYPSGAGSVTLNAFRAYFQLNNGYQMAADPDTSGDDDDDDFIPDGGGSAKPFVIDLEDGEATAIQPVEQFDRNTNRQTIYDLSGRKVTGDKLRKGIYIVNGRKEVVK